MFLKNKHYHLFFQLISITKLLLLISCAGIFAPMPSIGMSLEEFKSKNVGEDLYSVDGNLQVYVMGGIDGNSYYYFKDSKLIAIDKSSDLPIKSDYPFVYKQKKTENNKKVKLPALEPQKEKAEAKLNYNTDYFDYRYNESPISQVNYEDLYEFYIKDSRDDIVGYYTCEDLDVEIAIIEHIYRIQEFGETKDFKYLLLVTKSKHRRFRYFEQFGRISHRTSDKVFSGDITTLFNKVKRQTSLSGAHDTIIAKYGHEPVYNINKDEILAKDRNTKIDAIIDLISDKLKYRKATFYYSKNQIKINFKHDKNQYSILFNKKSSTKEDLNNDFNIGTGFLLDRNLVGTAYHVIEGNDNVFIVNSNNDTLKGEVLIKDKFNDLVLIKTKNILNENTPIPYTFKTKLKPKTGSSVYTIGYPFGDIMGNESRISEGIINSLFGLDDDPRLLQISNPIQPGNSGGILIDKSSGNLIGVVVSALSSSYFFKELGTVPQNVNFSIKGNYLKILTEQTDIDIDKINAVNLLEGKSLDEQFKLMKPFIVKVLAN